MRDFDLIEPVSGGKGFVFVDEDQDGGLEMNHQSFKRFRRGVSKGRVGGGLLPAMNEPRNLPARIGDGWGHLDEVPAPADRSLARRAPLVNLHRDGPAARGFDLLRTRLLQVLRENEWRRVAIAAPHTGCGATFTAVNLALSMARVPNSRTVLMDLNLRAPGVARALGLAGHRADMRGFLGGELALADHFLRIGETLALGLAGAPDKDAAERLQDLRTAETLNRLDLELRQEVSLFDLPPMLEYDDVTAFLPQVEGILLVADGTRTTAADISACERLVDGQVPVLGVVLNRARNKS